MDVPDTTDDGLKFDGWATAEPEGEWAYELDDYGITYGKGPWPFYRHYPPSLAKHHKEGRQPTSVRLSPNDWFGSRRSQYVGLTCLDDRIDAHITVFVRRQGLGGYIGEAWVDFALPVGTFTVTHCPDVIRPRVEEKARKVLAFLTASIAERDAGKRRPVTAHERYDERQRKAALTNGGRR